MPLVASPRLRSSSPNIFTGALMNTLAILLLVFLAFVWTRSELGGTKLASGRLNARSALKLNANPGIVPRVSRIGANKLSRGLRSISERVNKGTVHCPATAATEAVKATKDEYKVLMKVEIPEFIPRPDLMEQFLRWAYMELGESGKSSVGIDGISVEPLYLEDKWVLKYGEDPEKMKVVNGFSAQIAEAKLEVVMDDEVILGYDYIGMDENGFPEKRGNTFEVLGRFLEVRRIGDNPVSDKTKHAVKSFGKALNNAFDKYYAFGSIYSDDAT